MVCICGQLKRCGVVYYVRECDKGGRVVMGGLKRRFCVDMLGGIGIYLFLDDARVRRLCCSNSLRCC